MVDRFHPNLVSIHLAVSENTDGRTMDDDARFTPTSWQ